MAINHRHFIAAQKLSQMSTVHIESLGYVGGNATDLDGWRHFGGELLGMQIEERDTSLALRLDDRCQRILVDLSASNGGAYYGFQLSDGDALDAARLALQGRGVAVHIASVEELKHRGVEAMFHFVDPCGNRLELFCGLAAAEEPFQPSRPLQGFRTGELGMGHVVFSMPSIAEVLPFYTDLLGLRLSDYAEEPFKATFLHANARHHSVALIESAKSGLHHLMVELLSLDDVGQAYDKVKEEEGLVGATLGRHTNDYMLSFYAWSPSGFLVEYGWGGRAIDEATWRPERLQHGPSLWGHERRCCINRV
ncbi:VOC family protein [Paraburkholderia sp. SIMBA_054]|uniref:VOC family protein n=1 Tax=Paraburkholderia sp. SIMBA_054 TaxID=3085795 RepID=UPI003979F41F